MVGEGWAGLSTAHAITLSVGDSAALLDATAGSDLGAPYAAPMPATPFAHAAGRDPRRLKIALISAISPWPAEPEALAALQHTAALLEALGHYVVPATLPIQLPEFLDATFDIIGSHPRATSICWAKCAVSRSLWTSWSRAPASFCANAGNCRRHATFPRSNRCMHWAGRWPASSKSTTLSSPRRSTARRPAWGAGLRRRQPVPAGLHRAFAQLLTLHGDLQRDWPASHVRAPLLDSRFAATGFSLCRTVWRRTDLAEPRRPTGARPAVGRTQAAFERLYGLMRRDFASDAGKATGVVLPAEAHRTEDAAHFTALREPLHCSR